MDPENEDEALLDPSNEPGEVVEDALEETDEWGNPVGTEYDDAGEPILDEEPESEEPVAAAAATTPAPKPVPFASIPSLSQEQREYGEALFTPQQLAFIEGLADIKAAAVHQSYASASASVEAVLGDASAEYRRMMAPRMNAAVANMPPFQRASPEAGRAALLIAMDSEAAETGEPIWNVIARHAEMRGGTTPAKRPPVAVRPPATRAPAPSSAGRGPVVRGRVGTPTASKNSQLVASSLGFTPAEIESMGLK